ncbi:MAG: hypothetical protein DI570_10265 [Phenylobacterium zucineum]|nr:MAG: hypothetical protein DI570_10265 [Phenylobacterium zucineum]
MRDPGALQAQEVERQRLVVDEEGANAVHAPWLAHRGPDGAAGYAPNRRRHDESAHRATDGTPLTRRSQNGAGRRAGRDPSPSPPYRPCRRRRVPAQPRSIQMKHARLLAPLAALGLALTAPQAAQAKGGVTFVVAGNTATQPFGFTNSSDAGERITGFGFDISTTTSRTHIFDTEGGSSTPFTPVGGSDVLTGLTALPVIPDNAQAFSLAFDDFDVGETFLFNIDIDSLNSSTVFGNALIGARVWFAFSDGSRLRGTLQAGDAWDASMFVADTAAVPEPGAWALMILGFGAAGAALRRRPVAAPV